ncbi:putative carboxypeptidase suro-1 [Macrobrachium nipponense]|uniref:putative carboxypeptidase suro-1 n=1 Tax=Macrobrachium nipponense TaxID=159736 RepID=UPI0030C81FFF
MSTLDQNRLWRKNRAHSTSSICIGFDLNRKFGYQWGGLGTSSDPCSDIYKGASAFSEPESRTLRDAMLPLTGKVEVFHHTTTKKTIESTRTEEEEEDQDAVLHSGFKFFGEKETDDFDTMSTTNADPIYRVYDNDQVVISINSNIILCVGFQPIS